MSGGRIGLDTCLTIYMTEYHKRVEELNNQKSKMKNTLWLTGLSGAGKSTIAAALKARLDVCDVPSCILDGDELRKGLNSNLGFSPADRKENVRRVAEVAKLFNAAGLVSIVALISPYRDDRQLAADIIGNSFIEIFVDTDIETCRKRDPKGLYGKSARGEMTGLTGIDAPYEPPENATLIIRTADTPVEKAVEKIMNIFEG
ncbi:MAG: adenylyl-sulfate kinase [Bacteroidales bacterium]|jgi:bifunctional enzyme CysN/CysC|nr:adenylyl-sulfate kinase [Bacteroidales bacterium]